jgi:hypothetical protein
MNLVNELISRIKAEKDEIANSMVNGFCVNFESYQRLVGQSIGLDKALDILNNILEEQRKDVE